MLKVLKISIVVLLSIIVLLVAYGALVWFSASSATPQWAGEITSQHVSGKVTIHRDSNGVPHVQADNLQDALFAQGFLHAQDRLWQMAIARQQLSGRLAEWFGASALRGDQIQAHARTVERATSHWQNFPEQHKPHIRAYVNGINGFINSEHYIEPAEATLLHIDIEPWKPEDLFIQYRGLYEILSDMGSELTARRVSLFAPHPSAREGIILDEEDVPSIVQGQHTHLTAAESARKTSAFSDNWTVSGALSTSGMPLMANDPQLGAGLPNHWYLMRMNYPGRELVGGSLPGFPGIVVGHNGKLAWGLTAGSIDAIDITLAERNKSNPSQIRFAPDQPWTTLDSFTHDIKVRFSEDVTTTVFVSDSGSVLPNSLLSMQVAENPDHVSIWKWMGYDQETSFSAFFALMEATNVEQARQALADFTGPPMNFSLADSSGNIAYVLAAKIPKRDQAHATNIEYNQGDNNHWEYIDFAENPQMVNPGNNKVITANQKVVDDSYPYYLNDHWMPSFRAKRIEHLLNQSAMFSIQDFRKMQRDTFSLPASIIAPMLTRVTGTNPRQQALVDLVKNWNFHYDLELTPPTLYQTWVAEVHRLIAEDEMGETIFRWFHSDPNPRIVQQALAGNLTDWCDNRDTTAVESCDQLILSALSTADQVLSEAFGSDPAGWQWRKASQTLHPHLGFGYLPVIGAAFSRVQPYPGGPESLMINSVDSSTAPYFTRSIFTPSFQGLYDLSDLDSAKFIISGGVSGHFKSPYYDNFLQPWAEGEMIEINQSSLDDSPPVTMTVIPE